MAPLSILAATAIMTLLAEGAVLRVYDRKSTDNCLPRRCWDALTDFALVSEFVFRNPCLAMRTVPYFVPYKRRPKLGACAS